MKFVVPQMIWLMAVTVPLLVVFLAWAGRKRQALTLQFVQARLLPQLTLGVSTTRTRLRAILHMAAVALLFLALARPQWGFTWDEASQRGLDILVAIDTSRSMLAKDLNPDRLTRSKLAALDLLKLAKTDRLGLIAFAGSAFLQCPLTLDDFAFRESVNALNTGIIPQGGSTLSEAIEAALATFKGNPENHRALILFSDGEDHEDTALAAASKADKAGLKIFTVGVGTAAGELLRHTNEKGETDWVRDDQGNAVKSRLNEPLLQQIATAANGFYLPLRGANTMETLYQQGLAPLPKSELNARLIQRFHERFQWPLALAIALLGAEILIRDLPRLPHRRKSRGTPAPFPRAIALLVLVTLPAPTTASPSSAASRYSEGQFAEAFKQYDELLKKSPDDPKLAYNTGAAAYKAKDFEAAAKGFETSSRAKDLALQQRSHYNLGNTLFRQGEASSDPKQTSALWERSTRSFESALKLRPEDPDAQFNLDLVRKKLEELKKQQQQQDQDKNPKDPDQKDDQEQKGKQEKQDPSKKESSQGSNKDKQDSKEPGKDSQKQQGGQQDPKDKPKQDPASNQNQPDSGQDKKDAEDKKQGGSQKGPDNAGQSNANPGSPDPQAASGDGATHAATSTMTPQQAQQLLEAHRAEERPMIFTNTILRKNLPRVFKDW